MSEEIGDWWLVARHAFSRRSRLSRLSGVSCVHVGARAGGASALPPPAPPPMPFHVVMQVYTSMRTHVVKHV